MPFFHRTPLWYALGLALLGIDAQAQALPDAGQVLDSVEQRRPALPAPAAIDLDLPPTPTPPAHDDGPAMDVQGFAIEGNSAIATLDLQALLQALEGQSLTVSQLEAGAARITRLYRERGYPFAYAYLPEQTVEAGLVRIAVLEGRLGEVRVENATRQRANVIDAPLTRLEHGQVIRADALESSLLLLGDIHGAHAKARLQPGSKVGTSDLVVMVEDTALVGGALGLDNSGNRYTGVWRASGSVQLNGALGLGERIQLHSLLSSEHLHNYHLDYLMPLGPWNTRVGAGVSRLSYALGKEFSVLDAYGNATAAKLHATQPLVRSRGVNLNAHLQYDQKRLTDHIGRHSSHAPKRSRLATLGLNGDWQDHWGSRAMNVWDLSWTRGQLRLDSDGQRRQDAQSIRRAGRFQTLNASFARWQALTGPWSLYGRVNGQWADKNLDSSEKMSLGGAHGVRAYPQGEAAGDMGWLATLALRHALAPGWQLSGFGDVGKVRLQHRPWHEGPNHQRLGGAGIGVQHTGQDWSLETALAWRLGSHLASSAPERSPRLWIKAMKQF